MSDKGYVFKPDVCLSTKGFLVPSAIEVAGSYPYDGDFATVQLREIPDDAFHEMVRDWVNAVYKVAGKKKPEGI